VPEAALAALWLAVSEDAPARARIDEYLKRLRFVQPRIGGDDLRAMGLTPGPEFGRVLASLRQAWLDGLVRDDADERRWLDALLRSRSPSG
jgi:tRNA nucleotidyltransferase (CCA-adding enzyme)